MVTHDVDEALFLADRVALMTNGPDARLGAVLTVPFARPRERHEVMEHPAFFCCAWLSGSTRPPRHDQAKPKLAKKERVALAMRYLEKVGLGDAAHVRPSELSQGMQQRVGIARAFALAPRVLLLDEPFGMLDSLTRVELQEVLLHLWRAERTTALMVTHDVDEALFLADRVALMTNGPDARLGAVLTVPFSRPRERHEVMAHPAFFELREDIMTFLETHAHQRAPAA